MATMEYTYFLATIPLLCVWLFCYAKRKDLHQEMLLASLFFGVLSVVSSYFWWTVDWWRPLTITGTKVGIEDFLAGFGSGGVAVIYEVLMSRRYSKRKPLSHGPYDFLLILFFFALLPSWLFYRSGLTSFYSSSIALFLTATVIFLLRKDLLMNGLVSGLLMVVVSVPSYLLIVFLSPEWSAQTYLWSTLSGIKLAGIPIEEFIFWFLAGLVFGPFYEFWKGLRLKKG